MYILFFKPIFSFSHFLRYPFKWVIKLFSQSKFNHIAHTFVQDGKMFVSEAKSPYHRHIKLKDCFKEAKSKIYAYKVIKPLDYDKLVKFEAQIVGRAYDAKGAIYSEAHKWGWFGKLFKRKKGDKKQFCSETVIELCQDQGWINKELNENLYSPQEVLEILLDLNIIEPRAEIWE